MPVKKPEMTDLDFHADMLREIREHRLRQDIVYAFETLTGNKAYEYQKDYLTSTDRLIAVLKSRQIGMTYAVSFKVFWRCWSGRSQSEILVSVSGRAARTAMNYVKEYCRAVGLNEKNMTAWNQENIEFPNGAQIHCLPQSPGTIRSLHGNLTFDECAHYEKAEEIKAAAIPFTARGYSLTALTTPRGRDPMFHDTFWMSDHYKKYVIPWDACPDLTEENLRPVWDTMDEDTRLQEFCCEFVDAATSYFPWELIQSRVDSMLEPSEDYVPEARYIGVDIGRKKDLTAVIGLDADGRVVLMRTMKVMPFPLQREYLESVVPNALRTCIDQTGIGMTLAEELHTKYGSKVEEVWFTNAIKEEMATNLHIAFEAGEGPKVTIPNDVELKNHIHMIRRSPISTGVRFDADSEAKGHHCDLFWALALAWRAGFLKYRPVMKSIRNSPLDKVI